MSNVHEALKAAIELIEDIADLEHEEVIPVIEGLKTALSELEKCEPVGWQFYQDGKWHNGMETNNHKQNTIDAGLPVRELYTSPQPRDWVGLSDAGVNELSDLAYEKGDGDTELIRSATPSP